MSILANRWKSKNSGNAFALLVIRQALTKANILSGFEASGKRPFCLDKVVDRYQGENEETAKPTPSTPFKVDSIREEALNLNMTLHSHQILQKSLGYLGSKIVQYRVIEPNSLGAKELRTCKQIKPRSQKYRLPEHSIEPMLKRRELVLQMLQPRSREGRKSRGTEVDQRAKGQGSQRAFWGNERGKRGCSGF